MHKITNYISRTIDDALVKDGLSAVGTLSDFPVSKGIYMVVGGIATQSYLPPQRRRSTSDIDLSIGRPLNYEEFKQFSKPVSEYMGDKGYTVTPKKASRAFHLEVSNADGNALLIEFARRNNKSFQTLEARLKRELEHARIKRVEERDASYYVSSPEDIAVPKLVRTINSLKRNTDFGQYLANLDILSKEDIKKHLKRISELREEAIFHAGDPLIAETLRFASDSYDIRALSENVGFDELYFNISANDWTSLREDSQERTRVLSVLLPGLLSLRR